MTLPMPQQMIFPDRSFARRLMRIHSAEIRKSSRMITEQPTKPYSSPATAKIKSV